MTFQRTPMPGSSNFGAPTTDDFKFSAGLSTYLRDGGPAVPSMPGDNAQGMRPFSSVGKMNLDLTSGQIARPYTDQTPIYQGQKTGITPLDDYYGQQGGIFAGLLGALGGIFGQGGSDVGATIGKTLEIPLAVAGAVPIPVPWVDDINAEIGKATPYILSDIVKVPKNFGEVFGQTLATLGLLGRAVERTFAGLSGRVSTLPPEYQAKVMSGEWTEDEALDHAVLDGIGFTNDPMHNLLLSIITDPVNLLSLGVGAVASGVSGTAKVANALRASSKLTEAVGLTGELEHLAQIARTGGRITAADIRTREALNAARRFVQETDGPILQLGRMERMGLTAFGPLSPETSGTLVRVANEVTRITDPIHFFGGGNIGKRSTEHLATASSMAMIAAYKPNVVRDLIKLAERVSPDGREIIEKALAVGGSNVLHTYVADEIAAQGLKDGIVPFTTGANGVALNPLESARAVLRAGGVDANVGKQLEILIEKNKPMLGMLDQKQLADVTRLKLARVLNVAPETLGDLRTDYDFAALVHAVYYYRQGARLVDIVKPALTALKAVKGALPKDIIPERLTQVGERTLTKQRAVEIKAALKAKDAATVRRLAAQYEDFDWLNGHMMEDGDLLQTLDGWFADPNLYLLDEVDLIDPATGVLRTDLPDALREWAVDADSFGYRLALEAPGDVAPELMYRIVRDGDGVPTVIKPFVSFISEGSRASVPGRWGTTKMALMRGIRQERILWQNRRRFVTEMVTDSRKRGQAMTPQVADRIFKKLMYEAAERGVQPRGLRPEEMFLAAKQIIEEEKVNLGLGAGVSTITERQVVMHLLRAFRGDLSQVGVTQAITGTAKARLPGASANYWGLVSEKLYPLMRFTLNPVFMAMEVTEPYVLNSMRGIRTPLRRNSEGYAEALATHVAVENLIRSSLTPEGMQAEQAEMLRLVGRLSKEAKEEFGGKSRLGRLTATLRPDVARRKAVAHGLQTKVLLGDYFYEAFRRIKGEAFDAFWDEQARLANSIDRGTIAMNWLAENLTISDLKGTQINTVTDLLNPHNFGRRLRVTRDGAKGSMSFQDLAELLDKGIENALVGSPFTTFASRAAGRTSGEVLYEELRNGVLSRSDLAVMLKSVGVESEDHLDTIWHMATGVDVEEYWKGYRDAFLQGVTGPTGVDTRAIRDLEIAQVRSMHRLRATAMGLTEEEYLRLRQARVPGSQPLGAVPAPGAMFDLRRGWVEGVINKMTVTPQNLAGLGGWSLNTNKNPVARTKAILDDLISAPDKDEYYYRVASPSDVNFLRWPDDGFPLPEVDMWKYDWYSADDIAAEMRKYESKPTGYNHGSVIIRARRDNPNLNFGTNGTDVWSSSPGFSDLLISTTENDRLGQWVPFTPPTGGEGKFKSYTPGALSSDQMADIKLAGITDEELALHGEDLMRAPASFDEEDVRFVMSAVESAVSREWEGSAYGQFNCFVRGLEYNGPEYMTERQMERMQDILTTLTQRSTVSEPMTVYRGIDVTRKVEGFGGDWTGVDYTQLKVGDVIKDPGFTPFSSNREVAEKFANGGYHSSDYAHVSPDDRRGVVLIADVKPGFRYHNIGGEEGEMLTGTNQPFRVTALYRDEENFLGLPGLTTYAFVEPAGHADLPGVTRLAIEEAPLADTLEPRTLATAILYPDRVAANAADEVTQARLATIQKRVEESKPQWVESTFIDPETAVVTRVGATTPKALVEDLSYFHPEWLAAQSRAHGDFRDRMRKWLTGSIGYMSVPAITRLITSYGTREGLTKVLRAIEQAGIGNMAPTPEGWVIRARSGAEWIDDAESTDVLRALMKGPGPSSDRAAGKGFLGSDDFVGSTYRPMTVAESDLYDVLMGNTTRRADGRATGLGPVFVNDRTARAAGYVTKDALRELLEAHGVTRPLREGTSDERVVTTLTDANGTTRYFTDNLWELDERGNLLGKGWQDISDPAVHEQIVVYYNHAAREANIMGLLGRNDWTADQIQSVAESRVMMGSRARTDTLNGESFDTLTNLIPLDYSNGPVMGKKGRTPWAPLMDLLASYPHAMQRVSNKVRFSITDMLRKEFSASIKSSGGFQGLTEFTEAGIEVTDNLLPVVTLSSPETARDMVDVLAYVTQNPDISTWTPVDTRNLDNFAHLTPRIEIRFPATDVESIYHNSFLSRAKQAMAEVASVAGIDKVVMYADEATGDYVARIIDDTGRFARDERGQVVTDALTPIASALKRAEDQHLTYSVSGTMQQTTGRYGGTPQIRVGYGEHYRPNVPMSRKGTPIHGQWLERTREALSGRGAVGWDDKRLDDLRTGYRSDFSDAVRAEAPKQYDRVARGEDIIPGVLEDRRAGTVYGTMTPVGERRAIIDGFGMSDPVAGLHELVHVFAMDLDESSRQIIKNARLNWLASRRSDLNTRIAEAEAKAAAAKTPRTQKKYLNIANGLRNNLNVLVDEDDWGVQHEEFFVQQMMRWMRTGRSTITELQPSMDHFRNWTELVWKDIVPDPEDMSEVSPEMAKMLNNLFDATKRDTVGFSVDQQVERIAAKQVLMAAADEAFATQFYKKDRGMLERSINHPYIGLYPASYMWGKVLPEMLRFLALRPFGLPTPFLAWNVVREVSDTIRAQAELDPSVQQFLSDNEEAFRLFSMFFPALPQDIPANFALPVRRVAEQGLQQQQQYQSGEPVTPINWSKGIEDAMFYALGPAGSVRTGVSAVGATTNFAGDVFETAFGGQPVSKAEEKARQQQQYVPQEPTYFPGR